MGYNKLRWKEAGSGWKALLFVRCTRIGQSSLRKLSRKCWLFIGWSALDSYPENWRLPDNRYRKRNLSKHDLQWSLINFPHRNEFAFQARPLETSGTSYIFPFLFTLLWSWFVWQAVIWVFHAMFGRPESFRSCFQSLNLQKVASPEKCFLLWVGMDKETLGAILP